MTDAARAIYDRVMSLCKKWPSAPWGPAHIVIEDGNVEDSDIDFCVRCCDQSGTEVAPGLYEDLNPAETWDTRVFLVWLKEQPMEARYEWRDGPWK